jgi:ABC-type glucose/galactose transport system permease subunit
VAVLLPVLVVLLVPGLNKEELLRLIYLRAVVLAPVLNKEDNWGQIFPYISTLPAVALAVLLVAVLNKAGKYRILRVRNLPQ